MSLLSGKKILLLGFVVVLLVVIPLTVYLVQQQQKLKVGAQPASTLSFRPTTATIAKPTDSTALDIVLDPGTNQVSFVKLSISYDATKLVADSLTANTDAFPTTLQPAAIANGKATITLSVGSSADKIVKTPTTVAKITFKELSTATAGDSQVKFDPDPATQVLSIASTDQFNENVLLNSSPATVTLAQAGTGGTATPTPTPTPPGGANQIPVCTALNLDKQPSGTAPYTINFTAVGNDPDGTITKVSFNWGDGPITDVTDTSTAGGGIGTASVNTQLVHTYNNPGTYTANVILTDNRGGVSVVGPCTKTITVSAAGTSGGGSGGTSGGGGTGTGGTGTTQTVVVASATPVPTPQLAPLPGTTKGGLPAAGPGDKIISVGGLGIISIIVGALLLFGL